MFDDAFFVYLVFSSVNGRAWRCFAAFGLSDDADEFVMTRMSYNKRLGFKESLAVCMFDGATGNPLDTLIEFNV